ncbi:MAG: FAD:protein FMN transferase [Lachnospiraceae bacterium]|jgi:thiamine biosynthesis lipoprotein|nr:FAD:protein FMN transferase [Lachnospiraceae bacterium]
MKKKILSLIIVISMISGLLLGCANQNKNANLTYTDSLFDTIIEVTILDKADESIIEHIRTMCRNFDTEFGKERAGGDIFRINHGNGEPITVSDDTIDIIKDGLEWGKKTNGLFDITIAPLSELWNVKNENFRLPNKEEIGEAKSHVDYRKVKISGDTVTLLDKDAGIDLGGIAKGYIADKIEEYLKSKGIKHAFINLGGNVLILGKKLDGSDYNIGIQMPFAKTGEAITAVKVSDESVVTSGNYQRYKKIDGKIYHHIIDPRTGYPAETGLNSVTIICKSSTKADILSTTTFLEGYKKGSALIKNMKGVRATFIDDNNKILG